MRQVLKSLPAPEDDRVIAGFAHAEDAAVFRLDAERGIIASIDVITPLVDDARLYGAIAAANSLSDLYAMGGTGLFSLSLLGTPQGFPVDVAADIVGGGGELAKAEGAPIVGGHSIESRDLIFGLAVVGLVDPEHLFSNDGYAVGDALILTKPLGTGALVTALKQRAVSEQRVTDALDGMRTTNRSAVEVAREHGVRAATDISGFGLLGHAAEVAAASGVCLVVSASDVPEYAGARAAIESGHLTRGNDTNPEYVWTLGPLEGRPEPLLFDPQTSGGLLIGVAPDRAESLLTALHAVGFPRAARIGTVEAGSGLRVVPG